MNNDMNTNESNNNPYSSLFETYGPAKKASEESSERSFSMGSDTSSTGSEAGSSSASGQYTGSAYSGGDSGSTGSAKKAKKEKVKKPKSNSLFKKVVSLVLSGVLFGSVAGGTMLGINSLGSKNNTAATESSSSSAKIQVASTTSSSSSSSSSGALADVSDIVDKVLPSVVAITNSQIYESYSNQYGGGDWNNFFNYYFGGNSGGYGYGYGSGNDSNNSNESSSDSQEVEAGRGSGIIIGQNDKELLIVTNYHVIEDADSLSITFADNKTAKASVKGTDQDNDLAVVAVSLTDLEEDTKNAIAIATLNTSGDCKVGQGVIAIGNALGYGQSITVGYISALDREVATSDGSTKNLLQTDAAINPGNSGGALVNDKGEIIGINSAKYSDTDVEGMGFAIPISKVSDIIDDLMNQETKTEVAESERGYLGINAITVDSSSAQAYNMPEGVYVHSIMEGGAAANSELQCYDIITKINKTSVSTKEELVDELKYHKKGETITLTVYRQNGNEYKETTVSITLGEKVTE